MHLALNPVSLTKPYAPPADPVARVILPHRVPYGFHCHHMNEEEFQAQVTAI